MIYLAHSPYRLRAALMLERNINANYFALLSLIGGKMIFGGLVLIGIAVRDVDQQSWSGITPDPMATTTARWTMFSNSAAARASARRAVAERNRRDHQPPHTMSTVVRSRAKSAQTIRAGSAHSRVQPSIIAHEYGANRVAHAVLQKPFEVNMTSTPRPQCTFSLVRHRDRTVLGPENNLMRHVGMGLTSLVLVLFVGGADCGDEPPRKPLDGFVDLHTHPVSNVGFGGKLVYGGVSVGALLPSDPDCNPKVRADSEEQALGHDRAVHGAPTLGPHGVENLCGNIFREPIIHELQRHLGASDPPADAFGFPTFQHWPVWNDMTHQKMWVEWIRRSFTGGLRVMVALAVNNKTLGDVVSGANVSGPKDLPTDDKASADLQIDEIKRFVAGNPDFMEIALTAEDIARITSIPKLAVVVGVEIDHIGNLQTATWGAAGPIIAVPSAGELKAEIHRLYDAGVRYIFPIHLLDNAFGGTAAYENLFNVSNFRESGAPWAMKCACAADGINYSYQPPGADLLKTIANIGAAFFPGPGAVCSSGQRNSRALTANGIEGIREMMRLGMLIDIDHMSQDAVDQTLSLAEAVKPGGYPLNSGHNNVRGAGQPVSERALTVKQYERIGALHGMAGVGSSGQDAASWLTLYNQVTTAMGPGAVAGFGTDTNGFGLGMPPRPGSAIQYTDAFPPSMDHKTWNYNTDGVAHYGMLPDFLKDVGSLPGGAAVVTNVMSGTEYFYQTWRKAEVQRYLVDSLTHVGSDVGTCVPMPHDKPIACAVFNDGYSNLSPPSEAIYFAGPETACIPNGTPGGLCRRWFGRCVSTSDNVAVTFKAFNDGDSNQTPPSDAVYNRASNVVCTPDGTATGNCRRWFGLPSTADGRTAECYLFDDGFTNPIGPTGAIYYRAPGQVCMPDGSAVGACRKWFGNCHVTN